MRNWLLGILLLAGCHSPSNDVVVSHSDGGRQATELPPKLTSELKAERSSDRLSLAVPVRNDSDKARDLVFRQTGCSCYTAKFGDELLKYDDRTTFQPNEEKLLTVLAEIGTVERSSQYEVWFNWEEGENRTEQVVSASVQTFEDARVTSQIITKVPPEQLGQRFTRIIEVSRIGRDPKVIQQTPSLDSPVDYMTLDGVEPQGDPQEIAPGIWRQMWTLTLAIVPPKDLSADQPAFVFSAVCPAKEGEIPFFAKCQALIQLETPIQFPSHVAVGTIPVGIARTRRILIRSASGTTFSLGPSPDNKTETIQVVTENERRAEHWVELTVTPNQVGPLNEKYVFETDNRLMPQFEIMVTGAAIASEPAATEN
ncbi:MAG: hypothetical protein KDA88_06710 [Planctomycetaceae bacterium]|nr:hypothetical protein [Planctomycetaceae bacterium]MCB9953138.1 hypothetical protein [Planctomycetaceae bacterium]